MYFRFATVAIEKVLIEEDSIAPVVTTCNSTVNHENYHLHMLVTSSSDHVPPHPVVTSASFDHSIAIENSYTFKKALEGMTMRE